MFKDLKKKYLRFKAKRSLKSRYEYLIEVDALLEEYMTGQLLRGGSQEFVATGRSNLAKKQQEIATNKEFLQFLKNTK